MANRNSWRVPYLAAVLLCLSPAARGVAQTPEEILGRHGLKPQGVYFVLPAEAGLIEAAKGLKPLIAELKPYADEIAYRKQVEANYLTAQSNLPSVRANYEQAVATLQRMPRQNAQQLLALRDQEFECEMRRSELQELNTTIRNLGDQRITPARFEYLQNEFEAKKKPFREAKAERLDAPFESLQGQYDQLKVNDEVRNALSAVGEGKKFSGRLGPSPGLIKVLKAVANVEMAYSPETAPPPRSKKEAAKDRRRREKEARQKGSRPSVGASQGASATGNP